MTHIKPRPVPTNGGGSLSCCECVGLPNLVMIGRGFVDSRKIDCSDPQSYYNAYWLKVQLTRELEKETAYDPSNNSKPTEPECKLLCSFIA